MYALVKGVFVLSVAATAFGFELGPTDIVFHLFTRNNPQISEPLLPTLDSIASTNFFSFARRTIITIHSDAQGAYFTNFNAFLIRDHLAAEDVNVIAVDWGSGATMYAQGLANAPQVGEVIGQFISLLRSPFNYDTNLIRLVGVGLGGHIAGIAARTAGSMQHIVAIDPSLVGWTHHPDILNADDADVVEVLHATAGYLGYDYPLGDLDFYPNGGSSQNGCPASNHTCSQTLAYAYYAESLIADLQGGNEFVGTRCDDYEQAIRQQCSGVRDVVFGGTEAKIFEEGIYSFVTNFIPPFARG